MQSQITALLSELAEVRTFAAGVRDERRKMIEEVQTTPAYLALDEATNEADQTITELEKQIRDMTLEVYYADAQLPKGVDVKLFTVVNIPDEGKAKEWALRNFTPALKLDMKAFEKAAKDGGIPSELATVSKEARAQIATKL